MGESSKDKKSFLTKMEREVLKRNPPVLRMRNLLKGDPFWILVAGVLSSRTKDDITLNVIKKLKRRFNRPEEILKAKLEEIEEIIYPVGFYKQKARYIIEISRRFIEKGPPKSFEEVLEIKGVGRKVARIYEIYFLGKDEIAVDTHVKRITERIFGRNFKRNEEIEKFLKKIFPKKFWKKINWIFVGFGQSICLPKNPKCHECPIKEFCHFYENLETL